MDNNTYSRLLNTLLGMTQRGMLDWKRTLDNVGYTAKLPDGRSVYVDHKFQEYSILEILDDKGDTLAMWHGDGTVDDAIKLVYDSVTDYAAIGMAKVAEDALGVLGPILTAVVDQEQQMITQAKVMIVNDKSHQFILKRLKNLQADAATIAQMEAIAQPGTAPAKPASTAYTVDAVRIDEAEQDVGHRLAYMVLRSDETKRIRLQWLVDSLSGATTLTAECPNADWPTMKPYWDLLLAAYTQQTAMRVKVL